jgi:hypothetical protein
VLESTNLPLINILIVGAGVARILGLADMLDDPRWLDLSGIITPLAMLGRALALV